MYKKISLYIICLLLISAVSGEDLTCKAGDGASSGKIFTSGSASQCIGISKITTEEECELAAEYNRKNNIDKNEGFGGRWSGPWGSIRPPGCFMIVLVINIFGMTTQNQQHNVVININVYAKTKTCIKCPINTYSKGGTNPICEKCPKIHHIHF